MKLLRDKLATEKSNTVQDRKQYIECLKDDVTEALEVLLETSGRKERDQMYVAMANFDELYQTLRGQLLTAKTEVATVARHAQQHKVAKTLAEEQGGYFNGVLADA